MFLRGSTVVITNLQFIILFVSFFQSFVFWPFNYKYSSFIHLFKTIWLFIAPYITKKVCFSFWTIWKNMNYHSLYLSKIQFKRKGSWINLKRLNIFSFLLKFGFGHPLLFLSQLFYAFRFKKHLFFHALLAATTNIFFFFNATNLFPAIRKFSIYTFRGIRNARYFLIKRQGKVSQYKHLKSKIF